MSSWEEDIVTALDNLGGVANYLDMYAEIERIRPSLPDSWQSVVRRRVQDLSSDSAGFKHGKDLFFSVEGLGTGVWGLRSHLAQTPKAIDLPLGNAASERVQAVTYRVLRDTQIARKIKALYGDQCQLCGLVVRLADGRTYSEAHHIRPLGRPHDGPDTPENVMVLCPNHHVMCDYGAIELDLMQILILEEGHIISESSLEYHNTVIRAAGRELHGSPRAQSSH